MSTNVIETACTLDCPDVCSLRVTVEPDASGIDRIVEIDAAPANPLTDGWICSKVRRHARRVYAPERLLTPLIRTGAKGAGEFRPATWDEASALIVDRMRNARQTAGNDAVVAFTYNSSAAVIESNSLTEAFFAAIGATVIDHTICAATVSAAWESVYGSMASADPLDVVNSDLIVIWGANPTVSNTHFPPLVQRAVKGGARLVVIDPRRTAIASRADRHLSIRPGTDVVLAMAIANEWQRTKQLTPAGIAERANGADQLLAACEEWTVERAADVCGLDADAIRDVAQWWAATPRTMLRIGWGQERNANGGAACRAILALPVLIGHYDQVGSGVIGSTATGAVRARKRWPAFDRLDRRELPLHQIGRWLAPGTDDPCQVLFIQGANPAVMCPEQSAVFAALSRDDVFTVVHEQVLTDTARFADVVLPATTAFEIDDAAVSYGSLMVQPVRAVIAPVGESRSNDAVGLTLAQSYGFGWTDPGIEPAIADRGPRQVAVPSRQYVDTFPSFDGGRAQLIDPQHGVPRFVPLQRRSPSALTLISPATSKLVNSMFGEFQSPSTAIQLHPDDAAERGLSDGDLVDVSNAQAVITVPLSISAATRPGVAVMSKGVWLRNHADGHGVNSLTPATGDALVNGACFNDTQVEVALATTATGQG